MAEDDYQPEAASEAGVRVVRSVVPWLAMAALVLVLFVIWSGFRVSLQKVAATAPASGSGVATAAVEASAATVPTNTIAVTRVSGVKLRSAAFVTAKVLMTVKKGVKLQVLQRTDAWLRVREPDGLIGWTENLKTNVEFRTN